MSENSEKKYIKVEDFVGATKHEVGDSVEHAIEELDTIQARNEEIALLIESADIPLADKEAFRSELASVENKTLSFKEKFLIRLEKVAETVLTPIAKGIEAYGRNFGESKKKIDGVNFILENLVCENKEELLEDLRQKVEKNYLYSIPVPEFPLDKNGLEIISYIKKKDIGSMYDVESIIKKVNFMHKLHRKGVSLQMIGCFDLDQDFYNSDSVLENKDLIAKLILLDKTDFKLYLKDIPMYKIEKLELEKINLIIQNPFLRISFHESYYLNVDKINNYITEENLKKIKDFISGPMYPSKNISEIFTFVEKVFNLPKGVQGICDFLYHRNGGQINQILTNYEIDMRYNMLKNLKEQEIIILNRLVKEVDVSMWKKDDIKEYLQLNENIFDRCKELDIYIGSSYRPVSLFLEISSMSDDEFDLFKQIYNKTPAKRVDLALKTFTSINESLTSERFKEVISFIDRIGETHNLRFYIEDNRSLADLVYFMGVVEEEKDIDLLDLIESAFGKYTLHKCARDKFLLDEILAGFVYERSFAVPRIINDQNMCLHTFQNFEKVNGYLKLKNSKFSEQDIETIYYNILNSNPNIFLTENTFPLTVEMRAEITRSITGISSPEILNRFYFFKKEYLDHTNNQQELLNRLFDTLIVTQPKELLESKDFPFTEEQMRYVEIFKRINDSPSRELKNLSTEIIPLLLKNNTIELMHEYVSRIEHIFLTNNIPMVGKQYKVFEILYGDTQLKNGVSRSKVESLKKMNNPIKQRLTIFKDLMRAHIASADSNLMQYLTALKEGRNALEKFESDTPLEENEKKSLKAFIKKINILTGHIGKESIVMGDDISDEEMAQEIRELSTSLGVEEGGSIIHKFEKFFLKGIGIETINEAIEIMKQRKIGAHNRNVELSISGKISLQNGDLVKGVSSNYFDTYLDKGVYAPEFVGAQSVGAKSVSRSSDGTPFDTDLIIIEDDKTDLEDNLTGYGDINLILKNKSQFEQDDLDIFRTGVISKNHYGIRTGFGSTQIDAICIKPQEIKDSGIDKIKYFIAKKGFYIPICNLDGNIVFTKEDYDEYRKIFKGIKRYEGGELEISQEWKTDKMSEEIDSITQTEENISNMEIIRDNVQLKIKKILTDTGVLIHKGEFDDSLLGAIISDTGSTGRGSALDEKFDFDFVVKLDDTDWNKVPGILEKIKEIFQVKDQYDDNGMVMFRSQEIEIDGVKMDIDIGFNKKSDSEEFAAHDALKEKYNAIENSQGKQALLDTLTNIRFAKKKLKEAECYKKGNKGGEQQGGLGGIGVEYWIIQNGGDAVKAFKNLAEAAIHDGQVIPFEDFKKAYKVFSAGQNLRGSVKVENFTYNMSESGYQKMVELAKSFL